MSRYAFIDNIFGSDEIEENDAFDEDDDDPDDDDNDSDGVYDSDYDASDDDAGLPVEDDAMLARLDKDFRKLRARVRASSDPSELRSIRSDQVGALAGPLTPTTRLRTIDIIEAIDDRVTDLRARRGRSD